MSGDKYASKRVEVEALQVTVATAKRIAEWCGGEVIEETDPVTSVVTLGINVPTIAGIKRASDGDYVIMTPNGRFCPLDKDVFESAYARDVTITYDKPSAVAELYPPAFPGSSDIADRHRR